MLWLTTFARWQTPLVCSWSNLRAEAILEISGAQLDKLAQSIVDRFLDRLATSTHLVTIDDLAKATSLSERTLRSLKAAGKIPAVQVGSSVRFNVADVVEALKRSDGGIE